MLKSHMDSSENALVAISKIPSNAGHPLHKGTPRETFIKKFLESHLPGNVAIGTGEIIDANSKPGASRNQFDIVLYKKNYPKLDFGGGICGFLIESVIATIEVKSTLTEKDLEQSITVASNAKKLIKNTVTSFQSGYIPPSIINFVIAYDGPANISTIHGWIPKIHNKLNIQIPTLPVDGNERINTPSISIDAAFILNKGFIYFDNQPTGFANDQVRTNNPNMKWVMSDTTNGNLLLFFHMLQQATANMEGEWLNSIPYLNSFNLPNIQFGT